VPKVSDAHLEARREQILDGARRAFSRYGYGGATIARLEEETGLSRGAIFNYFENKWGLFAAIAERDGSRLRELAVEQGLDALVHEVAAENPAWLGVHLEALNVIRTDPRIREATLQEDEGSAELLHWIEESQREGRMRADVAARDLARFLDVVLNGMAIRVTLGLPLPIEPLLRLVHEGIDAK
jgi:AcrR family transcriptional regulator